MPLEAPRSRETTDSPVPRRARPCVLALAGWLLLAPAPWAGASSEQTQRLIRFNEGVVLFVDGRYVDARAVFEQLSAADPSDVGSLYYLGLVHLQLGEYDQAANVLGRVVTTEAAGVDQRLMDEAQLDLALAQVGNRQWEQGKRSVEQFLAANVGDVDSRSIAYFYLGIAEYHLGDYTASLAAFEQAAALDDDAARGERRGRRKPDIDLYRALILSMQERDEESVAALQEVIQSPVATPEQKELAQQMQVTGRPRAAPIIRYVPAPGAPVSPWELNLRFGLNYDTNVILLGEDTILPSNISNEADIRFGLTSDFSYRLPIGDRLTVAFGATTFHTWHASIEQFDVQTYAGRAALSYQITENLAAGIQYDHDYNFVGRDDFLGRNRVTPSLRLTELRDEDKTPRTWSLFSYSYEDRDFHENTISQLERDGNYHTFTYSQGFNVCQPWKAREDNRWLQASVGYRLHSGSTVGDEFDVTSQGLIAAVLVPLPWQLEFEFSGQWTWEDYKQPSLFDFKRREREDFVQTYVWGLSRSFVLDKHVTMEIRGDIVLTVDDATSQDRLKESVFSYDRAIYGISVGFTFR